MPRVGVKEHATGWLQVDEDLGKGEDPEAEVPASGSLHDEGGAQVKGRYRHKRAPLFISSGLMLAVSGRGASNASWPVR